MADRVVESLELKVKSDANQAVVNLGKLQTQLRHTARSIGELSAAIRGLDRADLSFRKLNNAFNLSGLSNAISQMERLDKLRFSSLDKLANAKLDNFNTSKLSEISNVVQNLGKSGDVSNTTARLVSSLARLANAGAHTVTSANAIKDLGKGVKQAGKQISSVKDLNPSILSFVSAIAQLANAGTKTLSTAQNLEALGSAVVRFMAGLQSAPAVSDNVLQVITSLGQLSSAGAKTGAAARNITSSFQNMAVGTQNARTRINSIISIVQNLGSIFDKAAGHVKTGVQKIVTWLRQLRNAGNGLGNTTANIRNLVGALVGFRGITGLAYITKETIRLGANLTEIDHIVESVFGDMAGTVDTWAKDAITSFGIAEHSAKQYAGTLSSMFQSSGISYKNAGRMAMDLVGLAGDLSAFYNEDTATSYEKIKSGLAGMVRPLRAYGIDLSAASLEEFRLAQGITTSYSAMSQAEKVMLRYQYLMARTTTQQGDFQRTSLSLANAMRTLRAYVQAVGTQIGAGMGSAIRHVVVWLNTLMKYLLQAASAFKTFMETIFGKYKGGASSIAVDEMGDMADYAEDIGDAAGNTASGLGDAADAASELKKELSVLPFDELNQLAKDQEKTYSAAGTGGSGGGGAGGVGGGGLIDWDDLLESEGGRLPDAINAWAQQIKAAFEGHDWNLLGQIVAQGLNKGLQKIYDLLDPEKVKEKITPWIDAFTTTFNSFVKWLDFDLIGRTIGRGINDIVYIMNRTIEGINWKQLGLQIANGFNGLFDEVDWRGLGNLVGNKLMMLWDTINGFVHGFSWSRLGLAVSNFFNGVFQKINFTTIADSISTGLNGVFDSLAVFTATFNWQRMVNNMVNGMNTFIQNFEWKTNGYALNEFLKHLAQALVDFLDRVDWEGLGQGIADFLSEVKWRVHLVKVAKALVSAFAELIKGLLSDPEGVFILAIVGAIAAYRFASSPFGGLIGSLVKAITGKSFTDLLQQTFGLGMKNAVEGAATSQTVTTAASNAGTKIGTTLATKIGSFLESSAGTALITGGLLTAIASLPFIVQGLDTQLEKSRGGNGVQTSMGTAWDEYINQLLVAGQLTEKQADALFQSKERYELLGKTAEDSYGLLNKQLMNYVGSQEEAKAVMSQMISSGKGQQQMYQEIQRSQNNTTYTQKTLNDAMIIGAKSVTTYKDDLFTALNMLDLTAKQQDVTNTSYELARKELYNTSGELNTVSGAYAAVAEYIRQSGGDVEEFNKILREQFGYTSEATQKASKDAEEAANSTSANISKVHGHLQAKSQLIRDDLLKTGRGMRDVGVDSASMEVTAGTHITGLASKVSEFAQNVKSHLTGVENKTSDQPRAWGNVVSAVAGFASDTKKNLNDTESETSKWQTNSNRHLADYDASYSKTKSSTISSMVAMIAQTVLTNAANEKMASSTESATNRISSSYSSAFTSATNSANSFARDFSNAMQQVVSVANSLAGQIQAALSYSMYNAGQSAGYSFASGFQSVHIPMPYMYVSGYDFVDLGMGGYMYIPYFSMSWYRAGGLFMGGKGQMIGVAEDGRDEAVLPLEDRRAMARIGSAIADAGGASDNAQFVDRIVERLADVVLMSKEDNSRQNQMLYVEVKTENDEVLARAVTRGQQKLDYRNNPTSMLAY